MAANRADARSRRPRSGSSSSATRRSPSSIAPRRRPGRRERPGAELPRPAGLPEVEAAELTTDALRDGILGGGSLLIRGLVDGERAERMRAGIDRTFEQRDALMQGADVAATTPWFDPFAPSPDYPPDAAQWNRMKLGGHAVWAPDSPRMMFELLDAFEQTGLTEAGHRATSASARRSR